MRPQLAFDRRQGPWLDDSDHSFVYLPVVGQADAMGIAAALATESSCVGSKKGLPANPDHDGGIRGHRHSRRQPSLSCSV